LLMLAGGDPGRALLAKKILFWTGIVEAIVWLGKGIFEVVRWTINMKP